MSALVFGTFKRPGNTECGEPSRCCPRTGCATPRASMPAERTRRPDAPDLFPTMLRRSASSVLTPAITGRRPCRIGERSPRFRPHSSRIDRVSGVAQHHAPRRSQFKCAISRCHSAAGRYAIETPGSTCNLKGLGQAAYRTCWIREDLCKGLPLRLTVKRLPSWKRNTPPPMTS